MVSLMPVVALSSRNHSQNGVRSIIGAAQSTYRARTLPSKSHPPPYPPPLAGEGREWALQAGHPVAPALLMKLMPCADRNASGYGIARLKPAMTRKGLLERRSRRVAGRLM